MGDSTQSLVIACGALAHELTALIKRNNWQHLQVQCLPAKFHNTPEKITDAVRDKIRAAKEKYKNIYVAYGDCGTGGHLDRMLQEEGVERIGGNHCYEFFAGSMQFEKLSEAEPGTFYLTDYLAQHFDRLILQDMGINEHPELKSMYFGNYKRVVYLAQREDEELLRRAKAAADELGLAFEYQITGLRPFQTALNKINKEAFPWRN